MKPEIMQRLDTIIQYAKWDNKPQPLYDYKDKIDLKPFKDEADDVFTIPIIREIAFATGLQIQERRSINNFAKAIYDSGVWFVVKKTKQWAAKVFLRIENDELRIHVEQIDPERYTDAWGGI